MNAAPRFSTPDPRRPRIGDKLLANAERLEISILRNDEGLTCVRVQVDASLGADLFHGEETDDEQQQLSADGMDFAREMLAAFAARKAGAA